MSAVDLATFRADVRHLGLARACLRAGYHRLQVATGLRLYRYLVLLPDRVNRELLARSTAYEHRVLGEDEVRAFATDRDNAMSPAAVERVLADGAFCYGILDRGQLASIGWYSPKPTSVQKALTIHFDSRYVYMSDGYTKPAYRGQNLHGIGLVHALQVVCDRGFAGVVTLAERINYASLVSAHRVGYRDCGTALVLGRGGPLRIWQTRGAQRYGLRLEGAV